MEDLVAAAGTVLLTGASSFTGHELALAAAAARWRVIAPLTGPVSGYTGVRAARVARLAAHPLVELVPEAPLGSQTLHEALQSRGCGEGAGLDAVALHHAVVGDFRSDDYDVGGAVTAATRGACTLLALARDCGARGVVITRSVFEAGEGCTDDPRPITGYAIAKTATAQVWAEQARRAELAVQHFTIANPVGPYEEPRFVAYLVRCWRSGEVPVLQAPQYIRDNVASTVLAHHHLAAVAAAADGQAGHGAPSMWVGSNAEFASRVAREFGRRWGMECPLTQAAEPATDEPRVRVGLDPVGFAAADAEARFWDDYAAFYAPITGATVPRQDRPGAGSPPRHESDGRAP